MARNLEQCCASVQAQVQQLCDIANDAPRLARTSPVSKWCVAQHVEHLALAGDAMFSRIETSLQLPPERHVTTGRPTAMGRIVMTLRRIPRNRAQAPEFSIPTGNDNERLKVQLAEMLERSRKLEANLSAIRISKHRTAHPRLGAFTPAQWLQFLRIHNQHHLDIIQEIERG